MKFIATLTFHFYWDRQNCWPMSNPPTPSGVIWHVRATSALSPPLSPPRAERGDWGGKVDGLPGPLSGPDRASYSPW